MLPQIICMRSRNTISIELQFKAAGGLRMSDGTRMHVYMYA